MKLDLRINIYSGESGCHATVISDGKNEIAYAHGDTPVQAAGKALAALEEQLMDLRNELQRAGAL